ncbi:hypothetical protein HK096_004370, partial [Nowakowskiella sp. JEL0078]
MRILSNQKKEENGKSTIPKNISVRSSWNLSRSSLFKWASSNVLSTMSYSKLQNQRPSYPRLPNEEILEINSNTKPLKSALNKKNNFTVLYSGSEHSGNIRQTKQAVAFDISNVPIINVEMNKERTQISNSSGSKRRSSLDSSNNLMRGVFSERRSSCISDNTTNMKILKENSNSLETPRTPSIVNSSCNSLNTTIIRGMTLAIPGQDEDLIMIHKIEFEGLPINTALQNGHTVFLNSLSTSEDSPDNLVGDVCLNLDTKNGTTVNFTKESTFSPEDNLNLSISAEENLITNTVETLKINDDLIMWVELGLFGSDCRKKILGTRTTNESLGDSHIENQAKFIFIISLKDSILPEIYKLLSDEGLSLTKSFSVNAELNVTLIFNNQHFSQFDLTFT